MSLTLADMQVEVEECERIARHLNEHVATSLSSLSFTPADIVVRHVGGSTTEFSLWGFNATVRFVPAESPGSWAFTRRGRRLTGNKLLSALTR